MVDTKNKGRGQHAPCFWASLTAKVQYRIYFLTHSVMPCKILSAYLMLGGNRLNFFYTREVIQYVRNAWSYNIRGNRDLGSF